MDRCTQQDIPVLPVLPVLPVHDELVWPVESNEAVQQILIDSFHAVTQGKFSSHTPQMTWSENESMPIDNHIKSKKAYLVSLKHKLKKHLQLQSASVIQVDRRWLNGFMAAGFHSGLISLSELKLEYMKAHRNAYGERMTETQEQQLERRLIKLCQVD